MILRTICCDVCGATYTETDKGSGFPGWAIIQGIAAKEPEEGEPLTDANMSMAMCCKCKERAAEFIDSMQKEVKP